jgi:hypothetical protein
MFSMDITREAECSQGRTSQVIRELRSEGAVVLERPVGQRVMFRQLLGDELASWKDEQKRQKDRRHARAEAARQAAVLREAIALAQQVVEQLERLAA